MGGNVQISVFIKIPPHLGQGSIIMLSILLRLEADHPNYIINLYLCTFEWELFAVRASYRFEHFFF